MGCAGSTENTKHGSKKSKQQQQSQVISGQVVDSDGYTTRGGSGEGRRPPALTGLGPHDGGDQIDGADDPFQVNPLASSAGRRASVSPSAGARGSLRPGGVASPRPGSKGSGGSGGSRPTSQGSRRRSSVNPGGAAAQFRRPSFGDDPAGTPSPSAGDANAASGGGGRSSRRVSLQGERLTPGVTPTNRRRSMDIGETNHMSIQSGAVEKDRMAGGLLASGAPPVKSTLAFHPRSRILPRGYNSRHNRHYKGIYKNIDHPEWKILKPTQRVQAQDDELNRTEINEGETANPLTGAGLPWPVVGTNWKHLKFSNKDHHVVDDVQTGDEDDDDLAPLCAIVDLPPAERDSEYLNGKRIKRTRQQVEDTMKKIEDLVQHHDAEIISIAPLTHDVAVSCCRVGYMRLTSVFVALTALVVDYQLLLTSKAGFLKALNASCARHFEDDFMLDVGFRLPIDAETGNAFVLTLKDEEDDHLVEEHEILSAFCEYLKGRFKSDIQYCTAVARALVDQKIDTRELDGQGLSLAERGGGLGTEAKITLGRKASFAGGILKSTN